MWSLLCIKVNKSSDVSLTTELPPLLLIYLCSHTVKVGLGLVVLFGQVIISGLQTVKAGLGLVLLFSDVVTAGQQKVLASGQVVISGLQKVSVVGQVVIFGLQMVKIFGQVVLLFIPFRIWKKEKQTKLISFIEFYIPLCSDLTC